MTASDRRNFNKKHKFTKAEWLIRIFLYSWVIATGMTLFNIPTLFFPEVERAYQAEAKNHIGAINRAQQAYYLEYGRFVNFESFDKLRIGIRTETENYHYRILSPMVPVQTLDESEGIPTSFERGMVAIAQAKDPKLKQYVGAVFLSQEAETEQAVEIMAEICAVDAGVSLPSTLPMLSGGEIQCPEGTEPLR